MKALSTGNKKILESGNSTLEILIAFAVLTLCMTAVIMIGFGNQSISVDTQTNNEALSQAEKILEDARANARSNFISVISYATTSTSTIAFNQKLDVLDISECKKQATSTVSWSVDKRVQTISLATFLSSTSTVAALGGDCPSDALAGNWQVFGSISGGSGDVDPSDIDAVNNIAYMSAASNSANKPDLLIYILDPSTKTILHTSNREFDFTKGFNSIDIAGNYAYVANNESTFQLQVLDISSTTNAKIIASSTLETHGVLKTGSDPEGQVVYFYNNKIYLGLHNTSGPELHIFCVAPDPNFSICNTASPTNPIWMGSRELNHNINDIVVRNDYAYLALTTSDDNDKALAILNVSNPQNIKPNFVFGVPEPLGYNAPGAESGLSVYLIGNKLYLGRQQTNKDGNFIIFDISSSTNPVAFATSSSVVLNEDIKKIKVSGNIGFLATENGLEIVNVTNPSSVSRLVPLVNMNHGATSLDLENNFLYVTEPKLGPELLKVFYPGP